MQLKLYLEQHTNAHLKDRLRKWSALTDMYWMTSSLATIDADIRLAGSTEYSARALRIALV
jgi:hypothetical protein